MTYGLLTMDGEVILKVKSQTIKSAIEYFSKIKKLPKDKLLSIFYVVNVNSNQLN